MMFDGLELRILLCDYLLLKKCEQKGMTMSLLMMMMPSLFLRPFESFFMNHSMMKNSICCQFSYSQALKLISYPNHQSTITKFIKFS